MSTPKGHRIALVNFTENDVEVLAKAGFSAELGKIGTAGAHSTYIPCSFVRPLYEYDVYVYNGVDAVVNGPTNLMKDFAGTLAEFRTAPFVRIAFLGSHSFTDLLVAGTPFWSARSADPGVTDLVVVENRGAFRHEELARCLAKLKPLVSFPIQHFAVSRNRMPEHPMNHHAALATRNGDIVACYGTTYFSGRTCVSYIIAPLFKNPMQALIEMLSVVADDRPELFPERPRKLDWLTSQDFAFVEENKIETEIAAKRIETDDFERTKRLEKESVAVQYEFIRAILTATESSELTPERRFSTLVKSSLEYLEFEVTDMDASIRTAIRKEDFWIREGEFFAIVEVTATKNKNPKTKEFSDLLGRMVTILKRKGELKVPDAQTISGLLILNFDIETHPFRRPRVYTGGDEEFVAAAKEQNIGLLSTVDLYRILIAVKDGVLSKARARELLRSPGRIEYGRAGAE